MVDKFNNWLVERYLRSCDLLSEFDRERIEYSMKMLLNETEKIGILTILFWLAGKLNIFILAFIVLMSLRIFVGGMHFSTRARCFLFTLLFFSLIVVLSNIVFINRVIGLLICGLALLNIVLCAPLSSRHRILVLERGKDKLKKCAVITLLIWTVLSATLNEKLSNVIVWTVTMQQFEILYYKICIRKENEHED